MSDDLFARLRSHIDGEHFARNADLREAAARLEALERVVEAAEELLRWHANNGDNADEPPGRCIANLRAALDKVKP